MIRWKSVLVSTAALALAALAVAAPARAQSTRPTVAILDLDYGAIQHWWEGNWDIGKGVADLIVDGLVEDGSFRIIERKRLDAILAEQNFSNSDRADPSAASVAKIGKALGVKYLIVGSITKFGTEKKGMSVGGGGFGRIGGAIGARRHAEGQGERRDHRPHDRFVDRRDHGQRQGRRHLAAQRAAARRRRGRERRRRGRRLLDGVRRTTATRSSAKRPRRPSKMVVEKLVAAKGRL